MQMVFQRCQASSGYAARLESGWQTVLEVVKDRLLTPYGLRSLDARRFLRGFALHLGDACIGSISEVFDAEEPFVARGCVAQAWSVAEVLRGWVKTAPEPPSSDRQREHSSAMLHFEA